MAGSFTQQCPSCEAKVLIKDPKQVGKKVDCPKCKYRFVIEAPEEAEAPPEEAKTENGAAKAKPKPQSSPAVTTKKPAAPPTNPALKRKPVPKKPADDDDDDEDDDEAPTKKSGGSMVVIIGVGVAVLALGILGIGGYFLIFAGKDDGKPIRPGPSNLGRVTPPGSEKKVTPTAGSEVEVTNLLPNETQAVFNFNVAELANGPIGRNAFEAPGGFRHEFVQRKFGLKADEVERLVIAQSFDKVRPWLFVVVRTVKDKPINVEELQKSLNLKAQEPHQGQAYFTTEPTDWLEQLGNIMVASTPQLSALIPVQQPQLRELALRVLDDRTLVVSDLETLKAFMSVKGQPKIRTVPAPAADPAVKGGAPPKPATAEPVRYATIAPKLKETLELVEGKNPSIIAVAWEMDPFRDRVAETLKAMAAADNQMANRLGQMAAVGLGLDLSSKPTVTLVLNGRTTGFAKELAETLRAHADLASKLGRLHKRGLDITFDGKNISGPPTGAPLVPDVVPEPKVNIAMRLNEPALVLAAELQVSGAAANDFLTAFLQPRLIALRAMAEMAGAPSRLHELAAAAQALAAKEQKFPRGAYNRKIDNKRLGRPYPPDERVSWMVELLPYVGHAEVYDKIKSLRDEKSWRDPELADVGATVIPAFVDARNPPHTWWVQMPSQPGRSFGATHFVGIAGVGLDAADYDPANDPAIATKMGIFGYDRETKLSDIKDGTSNTILLIQVPPTYRRPWIAGGGATVVGVPEKNSIQPFVGDHGGKKGTYVIMADGSVRFIKADIKDDVFKAMCTVEGGEKVEPDKETELVPKGAELKTKPAEK